MGTEAERKTIGLRILTSAFTTLNVRLNLPLMFDYPPGFVLSLDVSTDRLIAPRTELIFLEVVNRMRQMTTPTEIRVFLTATQVDQYLGPNAHQIAALLDWPRTHTCGLHTDSRRLHGYSNPPFPTSKKGLALTHDLDQNFKIVSIFKGVVRWKLPDHQMQKNRVSPRAWVARDN